jgi:hypothetical protein
MEKRDRFLLEEYIMKCWHVTDDIETIEMFVESCDMNARDKDKLFNMLMGIRELYNQRFSQTFELFEDLIREKHIN